jgi:hypothetical protein
VPAKGSCHALDRPFEDLAHLPGPEVTELVPHERGAVLVVGAIEKDDMEVRVQSEVGRRALHDRDRTGLGTLHTAGGGSLGVERVHRLDEDPREGAEQLAVVGEPRAPREREGQHPLAQADRGQHTLDEIRRGGAHPPAETRGAESATLQRKRAP